jgi:tRNA modification GTPase
MDLTQAEAVADLIDAGSRGRRGPRCVPCRANSRRGSRELQAQLTELRVYVEAAIDFPDEEIDFSRTRPCSA